MRSKTTNRRISMMIIYLFLFLLAVMMLVPFVWMITASLKLNKDIFVIPYAWAGFEPHWENYINIWTKIPLAKYALNTVKLTIIVTILQILT